MSNVVVITPDNFSKFKDEYKRTTLLEASFGLSQDISATLDDPAYPEGYDQESCDYLLNLEFPENLPSMNSEAEPDEMRLPKGLEYLLGI